MNTPRNLKDELLKIKALAKKAEGVEHADAIIRKASSLIRSNEKHFAIIFEALQRVSIAYSDIEGYLDCIDEQDPSVVERRKAMDKALDAAFKLLKK